jgi:hypothetical protein
MTRIGCFRKPDPDYTRYLFRSDGIWFRTGLVYRFRNQRDAAIFKICWGGR